MYGVFRKCGLKPWHALIPCLREIRVGEAVDMAKEGRVAAFLHGLTTLAGIAVMLLDRGGQSGSTLYELLGFFQLFTGITIALAIYFFLMFQYLVYGPIELDDFCWNSTANAVWRHGLVNDSACCHCGSSSNGHP